MPLAVAWPLTLYDSFTSAFTLVLPLLAVFVMSCKQPLAQDPDLVENIMKARPEHFEEILENQDQYEVQIVYTQINRDENNVPSFQSFYYHANRERYFYPASTVKMPAAFLALEKLNELNIKGLDKHCTMLTDSSFSGQSLALVDSTSASGSPSIAHYIKKIFLVSDNDAYNRLYEFIGQGAVNARLAEMGFKDTRIIHRLSIPLSEEENRHTNPVTFMRNDSIVYAQPLTYNEDPLPLKGQVLKGKGYLKGENVVNEPFDFTRKNFVPLEEMQRILRAVIFPEYVEPKGRFNLTNEDYKFLYRYISQLPSETTWPPYDTSEYFDAYSKFLLYGSEKGPLPKHIRIFNKIGLAYGYVSDHAYVVDFKNNVEFLLSAVIHTNENRIYNDGEYEYETTAFPFMKNLGKAIYDYELTRKRTYTPNLAKFRVSYDKVVKIQDELHADLYHNYDHYHIPALNFRRIKHSHIKPLLERFGRRNDFEISQIGQSVQGRSIHMAKLGQGPKKVLLWSQMHGDESTATRASFEIFNFFSQRDGLDDYKQQILNNVTLYFIPMLNPDGAEEFKRRNALSIDLNRDALRLVSPEAKILKEMRDRLEPDFGFNLHDQSRYYNVYRSSKTASISFLAPAYNHEKEVNAVRAGAMQLISSMNGVLQQYIPGQVGKYDDTFEPRAFGDNIQKWGTSTILIESGGHPGDREKKQLVKLNFVAMLHALGAIANDSYSGETLESYYAIPDNDRNLFDLLIRNGKVQQDGKGFVRDIGILYREQDEKTGGYFLRSEVGDMGDLSTYAGYQELDATGLTITKGELYPHIFEDISLIDERRAEAWLRQGYTTVRMKVLPKGEDKYRYPLRLVPASTNVVPEISLGAESYLILKNDGEIKYAIANDEVYSW